MQTLAQATQALLDSADSTGCSPDLTVVSAGALDALREALAADTPVKLHETTYIATHELKNGIGTYFLSNPRVEDDDLGIWIVAPYRTADSQWFHAGSFPLNEATTVVKL